jgi:hypothetical protein
VAFDVALAFPSQSPFVTRHIHHSGAPEPIVSDPEASHPAVPDSDCCGSPLPRRPRLHRAALALRPALQRRNAMTFSRLRGCSTARSAARRGPRKTRGRALFAVAVPVRRLLGEELNARRIGYEGPRPRPGTNGG